MSKTNNFRDQLKIEGVNARGFGTIPKMVMLDRKLTIEAKSIYAYFCSYAGAGSTAFPSVKKIIADLCIGEARYYKHFGLLKKYGYIEVEQKMGSGGKFSHNIYTLTEKPYPQNECTDKNVENKPKEPSIGFGCTDNPSTENRGTNINNLFKNKQSLLKSSFIQQDKKRKNETKEERNYKYKQTYKNNELIKKNNGDVYKDPVEEILTKADITEDYYETKYKPIVRAIESLYYRNKPLELNNMTIPQEKIRKDLQELHYSHIDAALMSYEETSKNERIKNRIGYLASCIYTSIFDSDLNIENHINNNI